MNEDLVTVIMPAYNCASFIKESIQSVQAQTYRNWELLIIDDNSQDNTEEIVLSIQDDRIHYIKNKKNIGAALSRNLALKKAKGRWISFLDSDDLWYPEKLSRQIKFMETRRYSFSYTRYEEIDGQGNKRGIVWSGPKHITKAGMRSCCWPGCLTVMYDAFAVGKVCAEDIRKNNDHALWLKVIKKADCYLCRETLARYRRRGGSISDCSAFTKLKYIYNVFYKGEKQSKVSSILWTCVNMFCMSYKKLVYRKKI